MLTVKIATSIKYGNYTRYKKRAEMITEFLSLAYDSLCKEFDTFENYRITIRPIKGSVVGNCTKFGNIELDPRRKSFGDVVVTLAHEMIHNEQYKTGRLLYEKGVNYWNGSEITNKGSTYKAYRNQPWEKEAFKDQKKRAGNILASMIKKKSVKKKLDLIEESWT